MVRNMTNNSERHSSTASSGGESWTSQETIKGMFGSRRHTPVKISTDKDGRMESEISPGTVTEPVPRQQLPQVPPKHNSISSIAPWESQGTTEPDRNRKETGSIDSQSGRPLFPAPRKTSNAGAPTPQAWRNGSVIPSGTIFSSFYDDSSEEAAQRSPGVRPGSSQEDIYPGDRRPSVASATTISSIGSKSSVGRGFHKKLNTFFGDEFPGLEAVSRQNSESSLPPNVISNAPGSSSSNNNGALNLPRGRNNSTASTLQALNSQSRSRPGSPASLVARPKTPHASEVTPWEFQEGEEPPLPPPPNEKGAASKPSKHNHHHHRLHFPGHRHTKSKEEDRTIDPTALAPLRPSLSRGESAASFRRNDIALSSKTSSTNLASTLTTRPPSPTPSAHSFSMYSKDAHHKRSLFDKFKRKEKDRGLDELRDLPGSSASLHSAKLSRAGRSDAVPTPQKKRSFAADSLPLPRVTASNAKDTKGRLPFKTKTRENTLVSRNPNDFNPRLPESNALWSLDTDFSDLSDIIAVRPRDLGHPVPNDIYTGLESEEKNRQALEANLADAGAWDAPDSWDVAKAGEDNMVRMRELDDDGNQLEVNTGPPYCLRVFRVDSTFAVLSVPLNTTVTDIIGLIRRKSFLHEDDDKYMITMKKHDLARELEKNERPLVIQRKLLQQAGYTDSDKIEEVGRDDNSYLVRFTFLPLKKVGYASLADDPETEKLWGVTSFQHLDLSKKSLVTIPVTLHKRATEIISLNLSRNLSINVPKDFVQACTNLKELKFIGNEAWKIPPSFSYATRLLHLDVSNNRLEQLEHVELNKLAGLAVLRFANNKLTSLPAYFGQYKALRSLNISSNCLTSFPDSITEITSLTDLDISFNLISNIPDISKLTKLQKFLATNNKLTGSFPESTRNLISLKEIDIRHNAIDHIDVFSTLPSLEFLSCGYNHISTFQGYFQKIGSLEMNNNPITRFDFVQPVPSLWYLNLAKAKLAALPDDLFAKVVNLKKLVLDKNHFVSISPNVGKLVHLDHLSIAQNALSSLPPEIGRLSELRYLDLRENNLNTLPPQIWFARKLETLNLSSNVLGSFPKPGAPLPALPDDTPMPPDATVLEISESELGGLGDLQVRRPSQISNSNYSQSLGSASPGNQSRKGSVASTFQQNRKPSLMSRSSESTLATIAAMSRKDSSLSNRLLTTFAGTMKQLYLADNRLQDEVFEELVLLQELRVLNVSYNILYDLPPRTLRRWPHLAELYLSGNELRSLPAEDLEEITQLRALHINGNKFQVLPAELAKVPKLAVMDVGSNLLKYNVSNWPYDWNWNWNPQLKYLNMSGNMRLEIKPGSTQKTSRDRDLTDFSSLTKLRVLGLMDVTLRSVVPDQNEDRRVRTAGSQVGPMSYGMADTLGKNEHLSTMDLVVERFRSHEDEYMFGMFDGQALTQGGSRIARYLYDNFKDRFMQELDRLRQPETAEDALRRSYLGLNKEIAIAVMHSTEHGRGDARHPARSIPSVPDLMEWDMASGCVATVLFIKENELYVSNVGDATALLVDSDGGHKVITRKHDPTEPQERQRIKEAGGYVSRHGKLNDSLEVSRAFGYIKESPSVIAAPHTTQVSISENHELILIASRELWQYMSRDFAVDMARSERGDVSRAAQKLRDLAIAFGASSKIMVMVIGINDLQKRQRLQHRTPSMSVSPSGNIDELFPFSRRGRRDKNAPFDSRLARLDQEVEPPTGQVTLVFTDIKNSTLLWETYPNAMRSAIKMHNELMRRQLRIIGGYEVKTEGDAFIVSFPTVTSALLWCFTIQIQLLEVQWPPEILNSVHGEEVCDADGNVIFRGLSVRIGMHWGSPVCEVDPVTKRMDYFGPMVNRSARISSIADGGQITVSADFIAEIQRLLETSVDTDRSDSINSDEAALLAASEADNPFAVQIKRELRSLSSQGFEVKELGERRLKGLENPEYIYLMYPHALSSRLLVQQQRAEAAEQLLQNNQLAARNAHGAAHDAGHDPMAAVHDDKGVALNVDNVWDLCAVALRLEGLCNALESPVAQSLKAPETALLERIREGGGEITDRFLWNIVEHQVSRVETCINTLWLRNMMRPFKDGKQGQHGLPMTDIFAELGSQLAELQSLKKTLGESSTV